jgi:hypothetical protein
MGEWNFDVSNKGPSNVKKSKYFYDISVKKSERPKQRYLTQIVRDKGQKIIFLMFTLKFTCKAVEQMYAGCSKLYVN